MIINNIAPHLHSSPPQFGSNLVLNQMKEDNRRIYLKLFVGFEKKGKSLTGSNINLWSHIQVHHFRESVAPGPSFAAMLRYELSPSQSSICTAFVYYDNSE